MAKGGVGEDGKALALVGAGLKRHFDRCDGVWVCFKKRLVDFLEGLVNLEKKCGDEGRR